MPESIHMMCHCSYCLSGTLVPDAMLMLESKGGFFFFNLLAVLVCVCICIGGKQQETACYFRNEGLCCLFLTDLYFLN